MCGQPSSAPGSAVRDLYFLGNDETSERLYDVCTHSYPVEVTVREPSRTAEHDEPLPLACVPGAIPEGERADHFALIASLFRERVQHKSPLRDGYEYGFAASDFFDLARFVENERRCCPFLTFSLEVAAGGTVRLRLTGPAGTAEFLDAELHA